MHRVQTRNPRHPSEAQSRMAVSPQDPRYAHEHDDNACFSNKLNSGIERMSYQIKYRVAYTMDG
ncbi:hypothetical protein Taro_019884 [Colocasia esculenta]|uniref:Uncharacterized protein n=1 Tax=Colocasia esculenta TaxID=4460 RepID=A0A843UV04_COLES|nr:hypothetical protein [Colocasia esculenta]